MRFDEVVRRLEPVPAILPSPPAALVPIDVGTGRPRAASPASGAPRPTRAAAVLVLLYPDDDGAARLVLTERVDGGGHHAGEVSFPGGAVEPRDVDRVATALREAGEEVGFDAGREGARVLGTLPERAITVSGYVVTPVLAVVRQRPRLVAGPSEVAAILEPPVSAFLPGAPMATVERELGGVRVRYAAYPLGDLVVWGMTAGVLGALGAYLGGPDPERG